LTRETVVVVGPYELAPAPLFGGQIRLERMVRELAQSYRVFFACTSLMSEDELLEQWAFGREIAGVLTATRDSFANEDDPLWGGPAAMLRALLPSAVPPVHRFRSSSMLVRKLRALFEKESVAAVWTYKAFCAEMARAAGARAIIVDSDDFEGRMLESKARERSYRRQRLHLMQARTLTRYEHELTSRFPAVVVAKEEDLDLLGHGPASRWVVPNGISMPDQSEARTEHEPVLLFVGALGYAPNSEAVTAFVRDVLPIVRRDVPAARFVVAGRGPTEQPWRDLLSENGVELHESPMHMAPFYQQAAAVVAPLHGGGGTSIKVLEALAFGKGLVSTPVAARGIRVEHGVHCLLAASPSEFAASCVRLLRDAEYARLLGARGRAMVADAYSWERSGDVARQAVRDVASRFSSHASSSSAGSP
jgi:polysaccharide biosynthesis protein PslH